MRKGFGTLVLAAAIVGLALAPAVVGALCGVYLFEVIARALQLYRF